LLRKLIAFWGGDRRVFSVVRVPPAEIEALRRLERERQRRIGIVALARRLLMALWRYTARGELGPDVVLTAS
jgi:predicted component of type VI protein secretion system